MSLQRRIGFWTGLRGQRMSRQEPKANVAGRAVDDEGPRALERALRKTYENKTRSSI